MIALTEKILGQIRAHAAEEAPKECCGLVVIRNGKLQYLKCRNIAQDPAKDFTLSPEDYASAEDQGEIVRIVHSHVYKAPLPSEADLVACELSGIPWLIVNWPVGTIHEFEPSGYKAPLIGRQFHHGSLDCYGLIRDYYREVLNIELLDFVRQDDWWTKGENLYLEGFPKAGFIEVDSIEPHDVLLMQIASPVINHAAIYVGENQIIQHCFGRLSSRDVWGGAWQRATRKIVRHKSQC